MLDCQKGFPPRYDQHGVQPRVKGIVFGSRDWMVEEFAVQWVENELLDNFLIPFRVGHAE